MGADADGYGDGFSYDANYEYGESSARVEDGYGDGGDGEYQDRAGDEDIKQEDYWTVITSFFDGMGLVRQQLESFNEFVDNTMQEIVDENSRLALDQYGRQQEDYCIVPPSPC
jgi:DNA-directed RNA polymerase II subunit RPB2